MIDLSPLFPVGRLAGLVLLLLSIGCAPQARERFGEIRVGLTPAEVEALLGRPSVVIPPEIADDGTVLVGARWQYGDNLSTITTAATFPRTVPDRVWVVWFDPEGRVASWRPPIAGATSSVESRDESAGRTPLFGPTGPPRNR